MSIGYYIKTYFLANLGLGVVDCMQSIFIIVRMRVPMPRGPSVGFDSGSGSDALIQYTIYDIYIYIYTSQVICYLLGVM